ncbi:collagen-like protein [Micromonospora arborensis]|uniref:collagen-like triple helix repeat-containing protein n=1 Tax=Micromonospora arborensis TaxID=2116518 RepID=UPI0033EBD23B
MVDSQNTPARQRPSIVSISSYLLFVFLACQVISLIITLSTIGKTRDAVRDAYAASTVDNADQVADVFFAVGLASSVLLLLFAIVLAVLALFNNQGRNGARITTWIVGGIMVCCVGVSLVSGAAGGMTAGGESAGNGPSGEEIQRRVEEALPSWVSPVSLLLSVISLIALVTALILLALPKANPFFRKATAAWEPPTPGASYPGHPQAPGQPGYPQAPGQPGYPQAPGEPGYPPSGEPSYPPPPPANRPDDTPPADRPGSTPPSTS